MVLMEWSEEFLVLDTNKQRDEKEGQLSHSGYFDTNTWLIILV
jgi:hypothetical protein